MVTTFQEIDWYDLPGLYDAIFDADTGREADFLEAVQREFGATRGKRALEPACGSGRLVLELARRGWRVYGTDLNANMLAYARERLDAAGDATSSRATLRQLDMSERLPTRGRFDLAHCFVSTFKYLLTENAARRHLEAVAEALKPGGLYVLGFHLSDYEDRGLTRERWTAKHEEGDVVCNIQSWPPDPKTRLERVRSRLSIRQAGVQRRSETHWNFRTYTAHEARRLLAKVPALEHIETFDFTYEIERPIPFDGEQLDVVLVLRRR